MSIPIPKSRETVKGLIEVKNFIFDARSGFGFAEIISYKDWGTETEIRFIIYRSGDPRKAQQNWRIYGFTPWTWRYSPLTEDSLPYFEFILNRRAEIRILKKTKYSAWYEVQEDRELWKDVAKRHFTAIYTRREYVFDHDVMDFVLKYDKNSKIYCVPSFNIFRPQHNFFPVTSRPDHFFRITNEAKLYFPRHIETSKKRNVQPIKSAKISAIKKQVKRRGTPNHGSRTHGNQKFDLGSEYIIVSNSQGHSILSVDGEYHFNIVPININKPTAYNFKFTSIPRTDNFPQAGRIRERKYDEIRLYVHHNSNVEIKQKFENSKFIDVKVYAFEETILFISDLGEKLSEKKQFHDITENRNLELTLLLISVEIGLAFIPVYGWIIALAVTTGQMVYTYYTEEDLLGEKVSPTEFAAMGVFGILGSTFDIFQGIRIASKTLSYTDEIDLAMRSAFNQVASEYSLASKGSIEAIEAVGNNPVSKILASFDGNLQAQIKQLLRTNKSTGEFLSQLAKILNKQLRYLEKENQEAYQLISRALLEKLLTSDGKKFENIFLQGEYERHLKISKYKKPLEWITVSEARPTQNYLRAVMGDNYTNVIKNVLKVGKKQKITMATADNIKKTFEFYKIVANMGLCRYKDLNDIRKQKRWNGIRGLLKDCYQFEHPLELRFARNLDGTGTVRSPEDIDVQNDFLAFIVPRTIRHAILLAENGKLTADSALLYTQHPKTGKLAKLIRHAAEHLFTPQQIADAVCSVLLEVNFHKLGKNLDEAKKLMDLLEDDFITLTYLINTVRGTNYKVPVLIRTLDDIDPALKLGAKGWPKIKKDTKTKVYTIENQAKVDDAVKNREKWAEDRRQESQ